MDELKKTSIKKQKPKKNKNEQIFSEIEVPEEEGDKSDKVTKSPLQKIFIVIYSIIIIGLLIIGGYLLYKYLSKNKTHLSSTNSLNNIELVDELDRKSISNMLEKLLD